LTGGGGCSIRRCRYIVGNNLEATATDVVPAVGGDSITSNCGVSSRSRASTMKHSYYLQYTERDLGIKDESLSSEQQIPVSLRYLEHVTW